MKDITQLEGANDSQQGQYLFRLGLPDVLRATMFGTITAIANDILRMPLQMPGHTSLWWMGILVLGKGLVKKFGSGILMGTVSGILAVILGLGKEGVFVFFKFFIPGLLLDIIVPVFRFNLESIVIGGICGALASLSKLAASTAVGVIMNVPLIFLTLGLGYTAICHVIYGAIGGALASILIKRLKPRLSNWD